MKLIRDIQKMCGMGETRSRSRTKKEKRVRRWEAIEVADQGRRVHGSWYRGEHTNFHPDRAAIMRGDAVDRYIGLGWFPPSPFITRNQYITAFGSCFASNVTKFLHKEGYKVFGRDLGLDAHIIRQGDGIVNTAALLQQFRWAFEDWTPPVNLWHDKSGDAQNASDRMRDDTRDIFRSTDVFIFTLGLSEVWYDKPSDEIFWRAIPTSEFDPDRHGFKLLSVEENRRNLYSVREIIRAHRPTAEIIITLSPVPLAATFRPASCITANAVSKASLRVAIDDLMRGFSEDKRLHYFPSYEMVTSFLPDPWKDDLRHPRQDVVDMIMQTFKRRYLVA